MNIEQQQVTVSFGYIKRVVQSHMTLLASDFEELSEGEYSDDQFATLCHQREPGLINHLFFADLAATPEEHSTVTVVADKIKRLEAENKALRDGWVKLIETLQDFDENFRRTHGEKHGALLWIIRQTTRQLARSRSVDYERISQNDSEIPF